MGLTYLVNGGGVMQPGCAWGENNTRDLLKVAKRRGHIWGHVDNIDLGNEDIDHVVVAPSGV